MGITTANRDRRRPLLNATGAGSTPSNAAPVLCKMLLVVAACVAAGIALAAAPAGNGAPPSALDGNIDVRVNAGDHLQRVLAHHGAALTMAKSTQPQRLAELDRAVTEFERHTVGAQVTRSLASAGVATVSRRSGALTAAAVGVSSERVARDFLAAHRNLYGLDGADLDALVVVGDSPGGPSGLRLLRMEQRIDGVPVFESETRFVIDRDGRLWRTLGALVPGAATLAPKFRRDQLISPTDALSQLFGWSGIELDAKAIAATARGDTEWIALSAPEPAAGPATARLVLFPLAPGVLIPAWSLTVFTTGSEDWYALIDAQSGALLWRKNMREYATSQPARFSVYVQADGKTPADSPAPQSPSAALPGAGTQYPAIARSTVNLLTVQNAIASPNGWIDDCPSASNGCDSTRGNNVEACLDRDAIDNTCDTGALDANGRAIGNPDSNARNRDFLGGVPRDFDYTPAPLASNPDAGDSPVNADSQRGALVQAFYTINWFHDRLFALGFDEAAGNFQQVNLQGLGGLAGDRVAADVQNSGVNGASFSTPADGAGPGRLQMSIFTGPVPDRDSALDANIVIHELAHGLSHRLIGNGSGLLWDVARSMGEGWSDFYSLALINTNNGDDPNANTPFGPWITYKLAAMTDNYVYGFRRFPYTSNNGVNPHTFADVDAVTADDAGGIAPSPLNISASGALEVHNAGTVWAAALWEVRAGIIVNSDVTSGNETMLQLVTDALKLTPSNPSFIDGRDALLAADCATNACANEREIWEGFADRGLGYQAVAPLAIMGRFALAHMGVGTSSALPHLDVVNPAAAVVIDDVTLGNGNSRLDPGETATLSIALTNPLHLNALAATGITATLVSLSADAQVVDSLASYPDIAPQATVGNPLDLFKIKIRDQAACGSALPFELSTVSSLGTRVAKFVLRIGTPAGVGQTITYTDATGLLLPISSIDGVSTDLNIVEDLEIADLNFRVDSLTHAVTGHLSVMLRAPNGYGTDLIWRRGALMVPNQGGGADFSNVEIDDDLAVTDAADLNQSLSTQAPFTGSWLPAFNGPFWNTYRPTPPSPPAEINRDGVGQLSRLDGTSTQGTWTISVANASNTLAGNLASWSLLVQPRNYTCQPFVAGDSIFSNGFEASGN